MSAYGPKRTRNLTRAFSHVVLFEAGLSLIV